MEASKRKKLKKLGGRVLTQAGLARRIGSSQARVARMESGDPQASLESMMRALAAVGYRTRVTITRARAA